MGTYDGNTSLMGTLDFLGNFTKQLPGPLADGKEFPLDLGVLPFG